MTVSPLLTDVFTVLRAFLLSLLPDGVEVIQAQDNRVPEPKSPDFVTMTPLRWPRLATDLETLDDTGLRQTVMQAAEYVFQIEVHGPASGDNTGIITTMFRSSYAVDFFAGRTPAIAPLYHGDPRQLPFVNAEQQYENRYVIELAMQVNVTVTIDAESAQAVSVDITNVETDPASWPNSTVTAP